MARRPAAQRQAGRQSAGRQPAAQQLVQRQAARRPMQWQVARQAVFQETRQGVQRMAREVVRP
ncbi:hypothetical protein Areg01_10570 [Actinoplanes regularis]|nr:hypothetical protein Areg01_10570 [Actinoplanes regularis]